VRQACLRKCKEDRETRSQEPNSISPGHPHVRSVVVALQRSSDPEMAHSIEKETKLGRKETAKIGVPRTPARKERGLRDVNVFVKSEKKRLEQGAFSSRI